jgi:hypothetical protein
MNKTTINISDLRNYSASLILEYLRMHPSQCYQIIIPWEQDEMQSTDSLSCMLQYIHAAYAGQLLYNCSSSFGYNVPSPGHQKPFLFEVEIKSQEAFAETLSLMVQGYFTHDEEMLQFAVQAAQYFDDAFNGLVHSDTWGLLHIADNILGKI